MPPRRIEEFDVYEFHAVIAEEKGEYVAIGYDKTRLEIGNIRTSNLEDARAQIRHFLASKSDEFVGYEGAINNFLRVYPGGFQDPFFLYDERTYKQKAHEKATALLSRDALSACLETKDYSRIAEAARGVFINLIFPNEAMNFISFVRKDENAKHFGPALYELLYGEQFNRAFDDMSYLLASGGVVKWTFLTYLPFILFPDRHMFLKPEVAQLSAHRLGEDFGYESRPRSAVYDRFLDYVDRLRARISDLRPRDNIDVQTFMYVIGKSGFVREGVERRRTWLAKQSVSRA